MPQSLFSLFAHNRCLVCDRNLHSQRVCSRCLLPDPYKLLNTQVDLCIRCWEPLDDSGLDQCSQCTLFQSLFRYQRFAWRYRPQVQAYIQSMKFQSAYHLAEQLSLQLYCFLPESFPEQDWDLMTSVPSSRSNIARRGYNVPDLLCSKISHTLGDCAYEPNALIAAGRKKMQSSLSTTARLKNPRGFFRANPMKVAGKRILLIDDVATTGATLHAAAKALLNAGARQIDNFACARSDGWRRFQTKLR